MGTHSQRGCHRVNGDGEFFAGHGYLEVPHLVQWMATLRCGLRCEHCLAAGSAMGLADMALDKVQGLIDQVAAMGVEEFLITGGEPLVREDLAEVIEYLGRRQVRWTLNTAAMPDERLRTVIGRHRPCFVAVSLDGPKEVHDGFRGKVGAWDQAMAAIAFFKSLEGVRVCAGTTVTTRNVDALDETFHLAVASGADQWGIHLLVPEGRAADRKDLFLSRQQLKWLIQFVAHKRRYFRVQMADEIGYLGMLEPLVRDIPLTCGAGRSQCVVLPDGEVVPCTTLDRSCSEGSLHGQSLMQIWTEGFQDLRAWRPSGKCRRCDYSVACRGGCWLQRKAGTQCFKDVWHVPGALKTAAGIAICLGGLDGGPSAQASTQAVSLPGALSFQTIPVVQPTAEVQAAPTDPLALDVAIARYYIDLAAQRTSTTQTWSDPGWTFFNDFQAGTLPPDTMGRCARVAAALETQQRSLSLAALCWRVVVEPLFDAGTEEACSQSDRQVIRDTLAAIERKASQWRTEIFEKSLDTYLRTGRGRPHGSIMTKSSPPSITVYYDPLTLDSSRERWGVGGSPDTREAAEAYFQGHHYADQMDLVFSFSGQGEILQYALGDVNAVSSQTTGLHTMGPFDAIETVTAVTLQFAVMGSLKTNPYYSGSIQGDELLLNDLSAESDLSATFRVWLPAGRQYTYVELLDTIYQQDRGQLLSIAYDRLVGSGTTLWGQNATVLVAVYQNGPLLWPAVRAIIEDPSVIAFASGPPTRSITLNLTALQRGAVLKDVDYWMF